MRREDLETLPRESVRLIDPKRVQEYAWNTGWQREPRLGRGQVAVYERPESREAQFSVPISRELQDYDLLMARAVATIAGYESRAATDVLAELLRPFADVLKFSESGPTTDSGDIPFEQGLRLFNGAKKTLLAAACSAIRPVKYHPRMGFGDAELFLQQCRLGQTERGSFVVTVSCPLKAVPFEPSMFHDQPFSRRVTTLLMRSLSIVESAAAEDGVDAALEKSGDTILSANLCEGLLEMAPEGEESCLRVTAEFSRQQPQHAVFPTEVRFRPEVFPKIEYLARQLRPVQSPQSQLLVGLVETLNGRPNAENRPEGHVVLRIVTPESDALRIRAELNADDYSAADRAHMHNLPVSVVGILRQTGRTSFRVDDVSSFSIIEPAGSK